MKCKAAGRGRIKVQRRRERRDRTGAREILRSSSLARCTGRWGEGGAEAAGGEGGEEEKAQAKEA
jgi:hypothetical protein